LDVAEADFTSADLSGIDLTGVCHLSTQRLGSANLAFAKLPPEMVPLDSVDRLQNLVTSCEKVTLTLVAACGTVTFWRR